MGGGEKKGPVLAYAPRAGDYFSLQAIVLKGVNCGLLGLPRSPALSFELATFPAEETLASEKKKICLLAYP